MQRPGRHLAYGAFSYRAGFISQIQGIYITALIVLPVEELVGGNLVTI